MPEKKGDERNSAHIVVKVNHDLKRHGTVPNSEHKLS